MRAASVGVGLITSPQLKAGNLDNYYFDESAPLLGGAITANVATGGAVWYNPAGLARIEGTRIDASVAAYGLRFGARSEIDTAASGAQVERLESTDVTIVPAALSAVRVWNSLRLGFGVFVPEQQSVVLRTQIVEAQNGEAPPQLVIDAQGSSQTYAAGPAVGFTVDPRVHVGVGLLGIYHDELYVSDAALLANIVGNQAQAVSHNTLDRQQIGVQAVLGVQLLPARDWDIGFTLRLPALRLYELRQEVTIEAFSVSGAGVDAESNLSADLDEFEGFSTAFSAPPRLHAGLSHQLGRNRLALEGSYQAPFHDSSLEIDWAPTLNGRIGLRHDVDQDLAVGGGLFTDLSPERRPSGFGNVQMDYYGVSFALHLGMPYQLVAPDSAQPAGSTFVFGTTLALSYALGIGRVETARIDLDALSIDSTNERAIAHELFLHVASSLSE